MLPRRCNLSHFHTVGFGPDSFVWLRKMAAAVPGGQFHDRAPQGAQRLSVTALVSTFKTISTAVTQARTGGTNRGPMSVSAAQHAAAPNSNGFIPRPANVYKWRILEGDLYVCECFPSPSPSLAPSRPSLGSVSSGLLERTNARRDVDL